MGHRSKREFPRRTHKVECINPACNWTGRRSYLEGGSANDAECPRCGSDVDVHA